MLMPVDTDGDGCRPAMSVDEFVPALTYGTKADLKVRLYVSTEMPVWQGDLAYQR